MSTPPIQTPEDMASALRRMVFGEVHRIEEITEKINAVEDELMADAENAGLPLAVRLKLYESLSGRRLAGQNFVLNFIKLLDSKGTFSPDDALETNPDAEMLGDLEIDDDDRKALTDKLRTCLQTKVLEDNNGTVEIEAEIEDVPVASKKATSKKATSKKTVKKKAVSKKAVKKKAVKKKAVSKKAR